MKFRDTLWEPWEWRRIAAVLFLWIATSFLWGTACKKDTPPRPEIVESAKSDVGAQSVPESAKAADQPSQVEQGSEKLVEPAVKPVVEETQDVPTEPEPPVEASEALEKAAKTTLELGELLSKMLQEMKPHGDDAEKMIGVQERFRPAIDETVKRGEALVAKLTQGEKILLQQHATSVLQTISEDFVGLPAEAVVPIVDVLFRMVGVETQHQFD